MSTMVSYKRIVCVAFLMTVVSVELCGQTVSQDPFTQQLPALELTDETIPDAIAKLSQLTNVPYSIEFPLGTTISSPAPQLRRFTTHLNAGDLSEMLAHLCELDPTFSWQRIGNSAHLLPRGLINDERYVLNRRLPILTFDNIKEADQAVMSTVSQLSGQREQVAVMQSGLSLAFARPLSGTFRDITVREAFDIIAQQIGSTYGWQFGGASDFRILTFHERLAVRPKPQSSKPAGGAQEPTDEP